MILFDRIFSPTIVSLVAKKRTWLLNHWLAFFVIDECQVRKKIRYSFDSFIKATCSVLVGVFSHFLLDLPTHGQIPYLAPFYSGTMPEWFLQEHFDLRISFYGNLRATVNYNILWISLSIGFAVLTLHNIRRIAKQRLEQKLIAAQTEPLIVNHA